MSESHIDKTPRSTVGSDAQDCSSAITSPVSSYAQAASESSSASASALDALLAEYRDMADSERIKGNYFESLVATYLRGDAQMKRQFKDVYLWRDWPGRDGRPDCGIDLVAIPHDGVGAVAIQCKFYSLGRQIQKKDVDSFLAESGKAPFTRRIFVETTGVPWGKNAEDAISGQQIPVTRVGLTDLRNSNVDWMSYSLRHPERGAEQQKRKQPRDHQTRAIQAVKNGFKDHDRGTLVMACGTGKTFTSLKIAEEVAEENGGDARVLFLVPSLALMSQTLQEWSAECGVPLTSWSVCSDVKVNRKQAGADLIDLSVADVKLPPTTDPQRLAQSVMSAKNESGLQVVFATYQSIDVIHQAQECAGDAWPGFDLIICDEAHRTTGVTVADQDESAFVRVHNADYIRSDLRLYMSATPRLFREETKRKASESEADIILTSMDDESIYGPVFHRLGFGEAVSAGLLTDYKVIVLAVSEDQVAGVYQESAGAGSELPLTDTAKLVGCWNALAKRFQGSESTVGDGAEQHTVSPFPMKRAVAFCKDIKTSKQVELTFPRLVSDHLQDLTNDDPSDNLAVEVQHVDGSMNGVVRGERLDWLKADASTPEVPVCRILSNARCLSEGVDVPTLDAVLFLNPRKSQVDVIQAVGRVMRKAPGKELGYIVLPVAIPAGTSPEDALSDNSRYQVIWQVLQAIRAHDERLDATINAIDLNDSRPENIVVEFAGLPQRRGTTGEDSDITDPLGVGGEEAGSSAGHDVDSAGTGVQLAFSFSEAQAWKDAVYAQIVKKVGSRLYWADWSKDIAEIAARYTALIEDLLDDPIHLQEFESFLKAVQETLNPAVDANQAVEMLAQHLITKPLFDAMFHDHAFTSENPVSQAMQAIIDRLASNTVFDIERQPLEKFYTSMVSRIEAVDNLAGKQQIMVTLFDKFFRTAFPKMAERLGIVFTPTEVVDYIIHSANDALQVAFGRSLGDEGVSIIEPFAGTGTFVARLLQSGVIPADRLRHKFEHEIFANEIVLLSYYIASINIEQVFAEITWQQHKQDARHQALLDGRDPDHAVREVTQEYVPFQGMTLTDTFQMHEGDGNLESEWVGLGANNERAQRQKQADLQVVIMNPPYSSGQNSANDNNQNLRYPRLDQRIAETYVEKSTGTNKNSLYDSYFRALRWATDRIGDQGVIAFVSNNSFIDGNTADGVRLTWQEEFSHIFIYNLRGGTRGKNGDLAKREGGSVFNILTGVTITVLVKDKSDYGQATIHYAETADYTTAAEKLIELTNLRSLRNTEFLELVPNEAGDWLNQRDETFVTFQVIGDGDTKGKEQTLGMFRDFSRGLATARDSWCYNFASSAVERNMTSMISIYNGFVEAGETSPTVDTNKTLVDWNRDLYKDLDRGRKHTFYPSALRSSIYRPFTRQALYFERSMNDQIYRLPRLFPTEQHRNLALGPTTERRKDFCLLMTDALPDLEMVSKAQWCSLYTWEELPANADSDDLFSTLADTADGAEKDATDASTHAPLDFSRPIGEQIPTILNGYQRRDNITDATLAAYRAHYTNANITKEDIFFYVYALLHHPEYRERYSADLKKMLPRIPKCADFMAYANVGRELAELHVNYEHAARYPLNLEWSMTAPGTDVITDAGHSVPAAPVEAAPGVDAANLARETSASEFDDGTWKRYRVNKPTWAQRSATKTAIVYNEYLTITGIPAEAEEYTIGGRSPLGWVLDRYKVTTDKKSGIVNDPNLYCREVNRPDYIVDLIQRLVTVSMRTQELLKALPEFVIEE